jgi:outer membrane immunogenic protein
LDRVLPGRQFRGRLASTTLTDNLTGASATSNLGGWLGGGQEGFNYQIGSFVWGVEGTVDWSSLNSTTGGIITAAGPALQVAANTQWLTTAAARFGFAADRALFYGKAGGGWVGNNATVTNLATGASASVSNTNSGWLLGAGLEYAFTPNWTAKVEYDYLGLSGGFTATSPVGIADTLDVKRQLNIVTARINYKFDW